MSTSVNSFLPATGKLDDALTHLAPVPSVVEEMLRALPDYAEAGVGSREYLRDCVELGLEHVAGACSAWASGAYFPCEASCRTTFEISVNIRYILKDPDQRAFQHQRSSITHQQAQLRKALALAEKQGKNEVANEVSHHLEMLDGQLDVVDKLAASVVGTSSRKAWPPMRKRLEDIEEELDYVTLYSVLCKSTHGDAEPLIERLLARIIGMGHRSEVTNATIQHFRETTREFSRMMVAHASFRLMNAAGLFADRYDIRPLVDAVLASRNAVRDLAEVAGAEVQALRASDAWKGA